MTISLKDEKERSIIFATELDRMKDLIKEKDVEIKALT